MQNYSFEGFGVKIQITKCEIFKIFGMKIQIMKCEICKIFGAKIQTILSKSFEKFTKVLILKRRICKIFGAKIQIFFRTYLYLSSCFCTKITSSLPFSYKSKNVAMIVSGIPERNKSRSTKPRVKFILTMISSSFLVGTFNNKCDSIRSVLGFCMRKRRSG